MAECIYFRENLCGLWVSAIVLGFRYRKNCRMNGGSKLFASRAGLNEHWLYLQKLHHYSITVVTNAPGPYPNLATIGYIVRTCSSYYMA